MPVGEPYSRKEVIYHLDDPDPEAQASVKAFQVGAGPLCAQGKRGGGEG